MKILLVGGAGFIGSRTALRLAADGHEPVILDSLDPQIHGADSMASATVRSLEGKIPLVVGDTRDRAALDRCLADAEAVYYFPACTGTGQSMYQVERYSDVNVRGAALFCEALAASKVRKVIVSSTRAIYGEGAASCSRHGRVFPQARTAADLEGGRFESTCPVCGEVTRPEASREDDPAQPVSIYGITKLAQEQLVANMCRSLGIPAVVFRYQNVYGPGQSLNNAYTGILSIFTQLLLAGREINLFEDGRPSRDFVHIDDVVEYNVRALSETGRDVTTLNLGSGTRATLIDLVNALGIALGVAPQSAVSGQFRMGDIRHALADGSRRDAVLGRHEFIPLAQGVRSFVDWVRAEGASQDAVGRFDRSLTEMRQAGLLRGSEK